MSGFAKNDQAKPRLSLLPLTTLLQIAASSQDQLISGLICHAARFLYEGDESLIGLQPNLLRNPVRVLEYGAKKYEPYNWLLGCEYSRLLDAMLRHLIDPETLTARKRDEFDPESGLPHVEHAECNRVFLREFYIGGDIGVDDRPCMVRIEETPE